MTIIHFIHIHTSKWILVSFKSRKLSEKRRDFGLAEEMERKLKLDGSAGGSVANHESSEPLMGERKSTDQEMKKMVWFNLPEGGSVTNQENWKPPMEKGDQADEDSLKAQMVAKKGKGPSASFILPMTRTRSTSRSSSKGQTRTLIFSKRLTFRDLLTGKLRVPLLVFLPKKREGKHGRTMVPFVDRKGEFWELEATPQQLSLNLGKFVKAHRLRCNDVISFYEDGSNSRCYIIDYERSGR